MKPFKRLYQFISTFMAIVLLVTNTGFTVYAAEPDREAQREEHKTLPIQTTPSKTGRKDLQSARVLQF